MNTFTNYICNVCPEFYCGEYKIIKSLTSDVGLSLTFSHCFVYMTDSLLLTSIYY